MLSVLYIVFTSIFKSDIPNYVLFLLLGLIMWNMFTRGTGMALNSILGRGGIITKVYFPREILPLSSCITSFMMMMFEFGVFFAFVIALQFVPPITIVLLPLLLFLEFVLALGLGLPLAVLNVYYRDIQYIWNVLLYAGFFVTPIFYSLQMLPEELQKWFYLSPITQIIDMARNVTLYNVLPTPQTLLFTTLACFGVLVVGYVIFRRFEVRVAEEL
jgi:lipopolysaccharide transport system permease protein